MALNRITYPTTPTPVAGDWALIVDLVQTGFLQANLPAQIDYENGNVLQGAVFQIGGVIYLADSDTAITGTESPFIKITPSGATAAAAYVSSLSGVTWNDAYNGYYDGSGNLYVFDEVRAMIIDSITGDHTEVGRIYSTLRKYADLAFIFSNKYYAVAGGGSGALCTLGDNEIAFIDTTNEDLRYYYRPHDGLWVLNGSELNISGIGTPALAALSSTTIAFVDSSIGEIRKYTWGGSSWSLTGSGLSIAGIGMPAISALDSSTIAFYDSGNQELRTYSFDGSNWSLVGSALSITSGGYGAIATLSSTEIAFFDHTNDELRKYSWDGSNWSLVGSAYSKYCSGLPSLSSIDENTVIFVDGNDGILRSFLFDDGEWHLTGQEPYAQTIYAIDKISVLDDTTLVAYESSDAYLYMFRISRGIR